MSEFNSMLPEILRVLPGDDEATRARKLGDQAALFHDHPDDLSQDYRDYVKNSTSREVSGGIKKIADERRRQIEVEGWTPEHDDDHGSGELALAASVYARVTQGTVLRVLECPAAHGWPWNIDWFKPYGPPPEGDPTHRCSFPAVDRVRCLVKAGALIAAEIDRLERLENEDGMYGARLPVWWNDFIRNVCELPGRTSPEDEPDAMIATQGELEMAALSAIESHGDAEVPK